MRNSEPHTAVDNLVGRRINPGFDPESRRALIAAKARNNPKERFDNLLHHLTPSLILECLAKIPRKSATGVDGMTADQALENLDWILPPIMETIHKGNYQAPPVRRVYVPKLNNRKRPIGIPPVVDRAIQASMSKILNEIYEQDFLNCSFGFRPKIGCHHALATIHELMHERKLNYALEVDIRDFFGSLSKDWLRKFLNLRIGDKRVLKLIDSWLEAGIMEDGQWRLEEQGVPQGGSISPLLSNIYLHYVLDLWFENKIKRRLRGRSHLVRYCDDFLILFKDKQDLEDVKVLLQTRLSQFGLSIAEEKTHTTDLTFRTNTGPTDRRRITFLGFNIFRAINRKGNGTKVVFRTEGKRFSRARASMKNKLFKIMHQDPKVQVNMINSILVGYSNYYGIAGNMGKVHAFRDVTRRYWRKCLSRRSQNGLKSWKEIEALMKKCAFIMPKIKIGYSDLRRYVRL